MDTEIDWQRELDSSFGTGEDAPVAHYTAAGRTALRRRRRLVAAVGTGATALAVGVVWSVAPGSAPRSDAPIANDRSASPERTTDGTPDATTTKRRARVRFLDQMRSRSWAKGEPPARSFPGGLQIREGAIVHERRDDLYPGKDTQSAALDLTYDGTRWWVLLEWDDGGSTMSSEKPSDGWHASFDAFVAASTEGGGMTSGPTPEDIEDFPYAGLVDYRDGEVTVRPGATVVRRVDNPMGATPPASSVGLVVDFDGETTWLSITSGKNGGGATVEEEEESGWLTFDQWLAADVALQTHQPGLELVTIDDGVMRPAVPGVEILDQRADPDVPGYLDPTSTGSGLALVEWEGERWFVLVVELTGPDSVTTFAAKKAEGAETLDEFIDFAEARADGGGLR